MPRVNWKKDYRIHLLSVMPQRGVTMFNRQTLVPPRGLKLMITLLVVFVFNISDTALLIDPRQVKNLGNMPSAALEVRQRYSEAEAAIDGTYKSATA